MKCTLATGKIPVTRAKSTRNFAGTVDYIKPTPRMDFSVKSLQELVDLLKKHQPESQPPRKLLEVTFRPLTAENETSTITDSTHPVACVGQTQGDEGGSDTRNSCQDAEGYVTKEPKKIKTNKAKARIAHLGEATSSTEISRENAQAKAPTKPKQSPNGKPKAERNEQNITKQTVGATSTGTTATGKRQNGKAQRKPAKRFETFQRHEALGQFGALADSESDDSADGDMDVDEEPFQSEDAAFVVDDDDAPYAFPDAKAVEAKVEAAEDMGVVTEIANTPHQTAIATRPSKSVKSVSISRHARRHKHAKAGVGLQEGAVKGMQTNMTNYMHQTVAVVSQAKNEDEALGDEVKDGDTIIPATPESQEGVMIGDTRLGTDEGDQDLPIQLGHWLHSFQGREVKVAANGQCAFLAIHATNDNHGRPEMKNTSTVVKDTTEFKWFVYSLMMANLRKDVELNLINPASNCTQNDRSTRRCKERRLHFMPIMMQPGSDRRGGRCRCPTG
ncbi:hypothetical protein PR001_g2290 [Phytophthora rubi]|uniref:Uncharacterized protein n=2 Tax=Phytophthora rubi TaxID=129364 RepID=A0A6A3NY92_9STRA|nr:hypothetical protein PR001_g2290 [Phytophthora rubi]